MPPPIIFLSKNVLVADWFQLSRGLFNKTYLFVVRAGIIIILSIYAEFYKQITAEIKNNSVIYRSVYRFIELAPGLITNARTADRKHKSLTRKNHFKRQILTCFDRSMLFEKQNKFF